MVTEKHEHLESMKPIKGGNVTFWNGELGKVRGKEKICDAEVLQLMNVYWN